MVPTIRHSPKTVAFYFFRAHGIVGRLPLEGRGMFFIKRRNPYGSSSRHDGRYHPGHSHHRAEGRRLHHEATRPAHGRFRGRNLVRRQIEPTPTATAVGAFLYFDKIIFCGKVGGDLSLVSVFIYNKHHRRVPCVKYHFFFSHPL